MDTLDPRLDLGVPLLLCDLDQFLPGLEIFLGADLLVVIILFALLGTVGRLLALGLEHDDTGSTLGAGRNTEIRARLDVEVGDAVLLAQDGEVHDNIHWGDVAGNDNEAGGSALCEQPLLKRAFPDSLLAFLDTAVYRLKLGAWSGRGMLVN